MVSVFTGNRWGADFDGDLTLVLHGDGGSSGQLRLQNNLDDPKFLQNQVDTFELRSPFLGRLRKADVSHQKRGYGAGLFLERLTVSETQTDQRQYFFFASVWLDEGQADRKLSRSLPAAGSYNLANIPDPSLSKGRWELSLSAQADGGPLDVIAFGSYGHSSPLHISDLSEPLQVDFGEIGDLYKLRLEVGEGQRVSRVDWVSVRDLDTGEELELECGKGLGGEEQRFRELPMLRVGQEPLPQTTYSVRGRMGAESGVGSRWLDKRDEVELRLVGEYGDTGLVRVRPGDGGELVVKVEAVSLGRLLFVNAAVQMGEEGRRVSEGLAALQGLYDKHKLGLVAGENWLVESVRVRESAHAPYQFVFGESRLVEGGGEGLVVKQLVLSEMEGLATKAKSEMGRKVNGVSGTKFRVSVTTGAHDEASPQPAVPQITLVGSKANAGPTALTSASTASSGSKGGKESALFKPGATNVFIVSLSSCIILHAKGLDFTDECEEQYWLAAEAASDDGQGKVFQSVLVPEKGKTGRRVWC